MLEIGNERAHFEAAFPRLEVVWLETSAGEDQVLLVTEKPCHCGLDRSLRGMDARIEIAGTGMKPLHRA